MRHRLAFIILLTGGSGCVYYNGLWNAHRWATDAQEQERDGRSEAAVLSWSQAAVEAESVAARHPHSGWLPDALVTAAEGLAGSRDCGAAAPYFARIPSVTKDPALLERAALAQATCALAAGDVDGAEAFAKPVLASKDKERRRRAALLAGRAATQRGDFDEAAALLGRSPERRAGVEEILALLDAGRTERADSLCDALVERKPFEEDWDSIFVSFARAAGPSVTSRIVGRVVPRARLTAGERARLFLDDGFRLLDARDPAAADHRFAQAAQAAPDSAEADKAEVARIWARVAQVRSLDSIPMLRLDLRPYTVSGGGVTDARRLEAVLKRLTGPDTSITGAFRAGEIARDSLYANPLAAALLLDFAGRHPNSVFAPKAIVAALPLSPERADSLSRTLTERYAASPYSLAFRGAPSPGYHVAEDSLAQLFGIRNVPAAAAAGVRMFATWAVPQTGKRGPLLNPPDVPRGPVPMNQNGPGRRAVPDSVN